MKDKKIVIASDHAGKSLKDFLQKNLPKEWDVQDLGTKSQESVDYPDFAEKACRKILSGSVDKAILICGSGIGMSIAANKFPGIRAAHVESAFTAKLAGEHNRANVLCMGERVTAAHYALEMAKAWLSAKFGGGAEKAKTRHAKRIEKIHQLEK